VNRPRRWPLHPEPTAGEALSSWLTRLAQLYDLSVTELLRYNLAGLADVHSPRELDPVTFDLDPPRSVLAALQERTGVDEQDLRRMTIAGWVPWLLDDVQPDEGTEAFTTYVRQDSVLLPPRRSPVGRAANWRPWLPAPPLPALMNRACRRCLGDPDRGLMLMAKIPLMLTCPEHGCRLDDVLGHPLEYLLWPEAAESARPVTDAIQAMDRLTHEGLSTGTVTLPRRPVNVGVWLRLLRTLLDEVATSSTRLSPAKVDDLRRIWHESGYRFRDGLGVWKVYEKLGWARQQAMLEAAATTLHLIIDGLIRPAGTLGHLLTDRYDVPVFDGDPPRVDHWKLALDEMRSVLDAARYDRSIARQLITFLALGGRSRPDYERAARLLTDSGVPAAVIPSYEDYLAGAQDAAAPVRPR
jgi:hypothetical protein